VRSGSGSWAIPGGPALAVVRNPGDLCLLRHESDANRHVSDPRVNSSDQDNVVGIAVHNLTLMDGEARERE
jgi:hypothetical protein